MSSRELDSHSLPLLDLYLCHMVALFSTGQALVHRLYPVSFHKKIGWHSLRDKTRENSTHRYQSISKMHPCVAGPGAAFDLHHTLYRVSPILTPQFTLGFLSQSTSSRVALCLNLIHPYQKAKVYHWQLEVRSFPVKSLIPGLVGSPSIHVTVLAFR